MQAAADPLLRVPMPHRSSDGWLTLELFSTRPMPAAADAAEEGVHGAKEGGLVSRRRAAPACCPRMLLE